MSKNMEDEHTDYIKREDAENKLAKIITGDVFKEIEEEAKKKVAKDFFADIPSADVVEVIRCKDCKYMENRKTWFACTFWNADPYEQPPINNYDFCSYGEVNHDRTNS